LPIPFLAAYLTLLKFVKTTVFFRDKCLMLPLRILGNNPLRISYWIFGRLWFFRCKQLFERVSSAKNNRAATFVDNQTFGCEL
jgi:hypothetical protein